MITEPVLFYGGGFGCFSNMSSYAVEVDGKLFMTSEHAYQYAKFSDEAIKESIFKATSGYGAKMISMEKSEFVVTNWDEIKLSTMERILRKKLEQHPHIKDKLLQTGERTMIEASHNDAFWGWGSEKDGENHHGKIWMQLRDELKAVV